MHRLLLALTSVASLVGLAVPAVRWKAWIDELAGGSSWFFELELLESLRTTAVLLAPTYLLGRAAWRLLSRPAPEDPPARLPWAEPLVLVAFLALGLGRVQSAAPISKDGPFYLSDSIEIAESGGLLALPGRLFAGEYGEDNRHPFYAAALSVVAERSDRFVDRARLFSLAGALLALLLAMRLARARAGGPGALLVGLLVATNGPFLHMSVNVGCESWLVVFLLAWFSRATAEPTARNGALSGAALGLSWLAKGTGTLVLGVALLHGAWCRRWRTLLPLLAGFALVALPLLWRNARVHHQPFYNVNSSHGMWLDDWEDFRDAAVLDAAGPLPYLRTHTVGDIARRAAIGAVKESIHVLQIFSPGSPDAGLGLPLLVLVALAVWRDDDRVRRRLLLLTWGVFFAAFSWYAGVVQGWRFLAVLQPLAALPLAALGPRLAGVRGGAPALALGGAGLAAALVGLGIADGAARFRPDRFAPTPAGEAVHAFLLERAGVDRPDLHYLLGPSRSLTCDWDRRVRGVRHRFPADEEGLRRLLEGNHGDAVRFAVVGAPQPSAGPRASDAWVRSTPGGLAPHEPPPGWSVVLAHPPDRPEVLIFEREAPSDP